MMVNQNLLRKMTALISAAVLSLAILFYTPVASAKPIGPCVIDVPSSSICTQDINKCNNASICQCPDGYEYSAAIGKCLVEEVSFGDGPGVPVRNQCALYPEGICTRDINACGHASICQCPDGTTYSPVVGKCLVDI